MWLFVMQPEAKISVKQDFQISKFWSCFEILVMFFASELNSYRGPTSIQQHGVSHNSFIDFLSGADHQQKIDPLTDRVNDECFTAILKLLQRRQQGYLTLLSLVLLNFNVVIVVLICEPIYIHPADFGQTMPWVNYYGSK